MDVTEGKLKRLRNLPRFKDMSEEELVAYVKSRPQKERKPRKKKIDESIQVIPKTDEELDYDKRFNIKLVQLRDEYGVDMNEANDAELIQILVRLSLQAEDADKKIRESKSGPFDTKTLKELGEYQKSLVGAITDIQDKLGITRKARKEKQVDDIPQYLKEIRRKAKDFWNRTTTAVLCQKCQIELARYWLNFPDLATKAVFELECWKCGEKVVYTK